VPSIIAGVFIYGLIVATRILFGNSYSAVAGGLALEERLAACCGLPAGDILVAPMPYFRKLLPQDVRIYSAGAEGGFGLFEKDRDHVRSLEGDYLRTFAVRVIAVPEERERVARQWERLAAIIREACGSDGVAAAGSPG
jgi:hypothetical protein